MKKKNSSDISISLNNKKGRPACYQHAERPQKLPAPARYGRYDKPHQAKLYHSFQGAKINLCPLKGIQTNRAEGSQAGFVYAVVIKSTHIDFLHIGILMGNVKPPAEKSSTGGLKNTVFLLFVLDTPEVGTFRRRICTAPLASQPPRLLSDRAANYGSIIVWKYRKAASSIFKVHGTASGLSSPVRGVPLL